MRCLRKVLAIFIFLLFLTPVMAEGPLEIVFDPTVDADIVQTFTFFENEIADLEKQIDDLDNALKLLSSGKYLWSNTTTLMNQLTDTMEQASGLSYAAKNEAAEFSQLFPGYSNLTQFSQQFQQLTKSSLDTLNNIMQTMQANAGNFINENSRVQKLQGFIETIVGQTQALQLGAQLASEQVSQLQLLRQAVMAQANAQVVYFAQQIQKEASATAGLNETIDHGDTATTAVLTAHPLQKPDYQ
jgi:P-type conjugative transfer protein TrbJ